MIFHNVHVPTRLLHRLAQDGQTFDQGVLAYLSPDLTAHVNRIGSYALNFEMWPNFAPVVVVYVGEGN